MKGSYIFSIDRLGHKHIPFFRRSWLTPDQLELAYLRGHGEFSPESDMAFERHLKDLINRRLNKVAFLFSKRKNLPNLRIIS